MAAPGPVHEALAALPLVDHHCHGAVTADLTLRQFESLITEGDVWPGVSHRNARRLYGPPVSEPARQPCGRPTRKV